MNKREGCNKRVNKSKFSVPRPLALDPAGEGIDKRDYLIKDAENNYSDGEDSHVTSSCVTIRSCSFT